MEEARNITSLIYMNQILRKIRKLIPYDLIQIIFVGQSVKNIGKFLFNQR